MYVRELRVRYRQRHIRRGPALPDRFESTRDAAHAFMQVLHEEAIEVCGVFCLSARHHVLAHPELSRGTTDSARMHPRETFKVALLTNATAIALGHNHPSGDPTPSSDDLVLTARLERASEPMGIELFDHIIVAQDRYVSLRKLGRL